MKKTFGSVQSSTSKRYIKTMNKVRSHAGKYETALQKYIPQEVKTWTPLHVELLTAAGTIDRLTADIIRDSKSLSEKFARYAEEVELRGEGWSPLGYSSLRDLDLNIAQVAVHKEYFRNLLCTLDPEAPKAFLKDLAVG